MKRLLTLLIALISAASLISCGGTDTKRLPDPEFTGMRAICELAAMDCYYHNVAKFDGASKVFFGLFEKDKKFWMEYDGIVSVGIDASLVTIKVDGTNVTVTIPSAKVLSCHTNIGEENGENNQVRYVSAKNTAKITGEDEKQALLNAKDTMMQVASANEALLENAQQQAKTLLANYITTLGTTFGKDYSIKWVYVDDDGNPIGKTETETTSVDE